MSVTSGFFNSLNHDRRYNARQMSAIFDGIINDGIFANIGAAFAITADSGVTINIGVGKAWFNSAWVYNDALLPKTLEGSEVVLDRIDAVVIEVDHNESVRNGDIKIIKGTPSSSPKRPAMADETNKHQHPLAYIYRKAGSTNITQADITNMVGTSECPYITGILQVQNIDNIVAQWNAQWNQWYTEKINQTDTDASELLAEMKSEFDIWFNDVRTLLEDDVATALAAQVAELQGKFDTLAREGAIYDTVKDSDFDIILGSDGTPIQSKAVFTSSNNDNTNVVYVEKVSSKGVSPRNLLDNSDFSNQVSNRAFGAALGPMYFIERWKISNGNVFAINIDTPNTFYTGPINAKGYIYLKSIEGLAGEFLQYIEPGVIKEEHKYTVVCTLKDGSIHYATGKASTLMQEISKDFYTNNGEILGTVLFKYDSNSKLYMVAFRTSNTDGMYIKNVALYEGEYTSDNLPVYTPKGWAVEYNECARYYQRIYLVRPVVSFPTRSKVALAIPMPMRMRITPTVSFEDSDVTSIRCNNENTEITLLDDQCDVDDGYSARVHNSVLPVSIGFTPTMPELKNIYNPGYLVGTLVITLDADL